MMLFRAQNIIKSLKSISCKLETDVDLSKKSSIHIGGEAAIWYTPKNIDGLCSVIRLLSDHNITWKVVGKGSNMLFPDGRSETVFISSISDFLSRIIIKDDILLAGSGCSLASVISRTCGSGLTGFEYLVGIPGTIGGAIKTNASYIKSVSDLLLKVKVLKVNGDCEWIENKDKMFKYRDSILPPECIILEGMFKLKKGIPSEIKERLKKNFIAKKHKQPLEKMTLGCIFKNPEGRTLSSGQILEKAGLKGVGYGGAFFSEKHANFIVNKGNATSQDVVHLIEKAKRKVKNEFGIDLDTEISILGANS